MTKSFRLTNLCIILILVLSSCSSKVLPTPLLKAGSDMQTFNMQINFKKQSFSGMLIVQHRTDNEIRIVASTFFGPTLFDFGLKDGQFNIYSCIEPLHNKRVIRLFENDFKKIFLSNQAFRKIKSHEEYTEHIFGKIFGKSIFQTFKSQNNGFEKLTIKHPWIGVNISLERL